MSEISKYAALLKRLQTDETYEALIKLYGDTMDKWQKDSPMRDSEYETLKALFINEGKKEGLREFFKNIETYHG